MSHSRMVAAVASTHSPTCPVQCTSVVYSTATHLPRLGLEAAAPGRRPAPRRCRVRTLPGRANRLQNHLPTQVK